MFSTVGEQRIMYCGDRVTGRIALRGSRLVGTISRGYVCTHVDTHKACGYVTLRVCRHLCVTLMWICLFIVYLSTLTVPDAWALKDLKAVQRLRWLVASLLPQMLGFNPRPLCVCVICGWEWHWDRFLSEDFSVIQSVLHTHPIHIILWFWNVVK